MLNTFTGVGHYSGPNLYGLHYTPAQCVGVILGSEAICVGIQLGC